jgi:hypothetical protein
MNQSGEIGELERALAVLALAASETNGKLAPGHCLLDRIHNPGPAQIVRGNSHSELLGLPLTPIALRIHDHEL